jgi:hypothetical protein
MGYGSWNHRVVDMTEENGGEPRCLKYEKFFITMTECLLGMVSQALCPRRWRDWLNC